MVTRGVAWFYSPLGEGGRFYSMTPRLIKGLQRDSLEKFEVVPCSWKILRIVASLMPQKANGDCCFPGNSVGERVECSRGRA